MTTKRTAITCAIAAAALYAVNLPLSKLLLEKVRPTMLAALLYLGAGLGLALWQMLTGREGKHPPLTRKELPYILGMILLDIAAPILLLFGLKYTNSANASLLNNFEIVATSLIAFGLFREVLTRRLWLAVVLVTLASIVLSFEGEGSFQFNLGSLLVLGACVCWGFENNCTRMLSARSSVQITTIKGLFSGLGSLIIALCIGEALPGLRWIVVALVLGFVSYGLSINFYIQAQKELGAAKTSAYYAVAPFIGAALGMLLLGERPGLPFWVGLAIMIGATVLMVRDSVCLQHTHTHVHVHTHAHSHGSLTHTHEHTHEHAHTHIHGREEGVHTHAHNTLEGHEHAHT